MIRTQVQLHEAQHRTIRSVAKRRGITMAEFIRRAVDDALARDEQQRRGRWERMSAVIGACSDIEGARDVAVSHDDYLEGAHEE